MTPGAPPRVGDWLWLCRPGAEGDLADEIRAATRGGDASVVGTGLVRSAKRPRDGAGPIDLAFARQGLPVDALVTGGPDAAAFARAIAGALRASLRPPHPFALHVFVPDSDALNPLAAHAAGVETALVAELLPPPRAGAPTDDRLVRADAAPTGSVRLAEVCLLARDRAAVGTLPVAAAPSLVPGGRRRTSGPRDAPSRAAAKLLEAFEWLGRAPDPGDVCVDLGAAPGGWSQVLVERGASVIAVDPARLARALLESPHLTHVRKSAFEFALAEPVDWLLCDMAWRPLEVAALLAKWGRRRGARFLVANIKLPMRKKVELLARVREILLDGGWRDLKVRQLYHDRDEVTVGAWHLV